ncbi:MAG TPA: EAL domain-containing protein [Thiomicrospira sp.]|nr:EAL domain-containing protein [Thiomicrospira sp.]
MINQPSYQSQLFRQIFKSILVIMLAVLIVLSFIIHLTIQSTVKQEMTTISNSIISLAGDQVKRGMLIEDISQLNSIAKLIVKNEQNGVKKVEALIAGEEQPLAVYPPNSEQITQCKVTSVPVKINEMQIGSLNICFTDKELSADLRSLTPTLIITILLSFIGLLLLILRIVSQHVERIYAISTAIKRYSDGETNVQVEVKNHNELGHLEQFFNQMVTTLDQAKAKVRQMAFYKESSQLPNKLKLIEDLPNRSDNFSVNIFIIEGHDHIEQTFGEKYSNQVIHSFIECLNLHLADGVIYHISSNVFIVLDSELTPELTEHLSGKLSLGFSGDTEIALKVKGSSFTCKPSMGHDVSKTILRMVRYIQNKEAEFIHLDEQAFERVLKGYQIAENLLKGDTQGLQVHAQVIYPVQPDEWPHVELLVRYQDEEHGLLSPFFFLNQVTELGSIYELDRFMLAQAESLLERYGDTELMIFVNLTPATLFSRSFKEWLHHHEFNKEIQKRIVFEVNEGFFIEMEEESIQLFNEIHQAGFRLALDDFGSGFSSYNWLSQLPISYLKIDRSLILVEGKKADMVLASISSLATNLDIATIEEGVETEEQYDRIVGHGFNQIQGYYLDRPGPVEEKIQKILDMDLKKSGSK